MKIGAINDTYSFYNSVNRISPRESMDAMRASKLQQSSKVDSSTNTESSDNTNSPVSSAIYQREDYAGPSEAKVSTDNSYHKQTITSRRDDIDKLASKLMDYMPQIMSDMNDMFNTAPNVSDKVVISENDNIQNNQNNIQNTMMENISLS